MFRALRSARQLLSLVLAWAVFASSSAWAAVDVADRIEHGMEQAQTLPSEPAKDTGGCKHGCVGHMVVHLSAPTATLSAEPNMPVTGRIASTPAQHVVFPPPQSFYRPPRLLLN